MYKMELRDRTLVRFFDRGHSLGARTALRRNDSFEDLNKTTITVVSMGRTTSKNNN